MATLEAFQDSQEQDGSEDLFDDQDTTGTVTLRDIMLELKELRGVIEKMQNPSRPFRIQESIYKGRFQNQLKDLFSKDPWLSVSNDAFQMEVKRIIRRAGYSGDTTATGNLYSFATTQFTYFRNMLKRKTNVIKVSQTDSETATFIENGVQACANLRKLAKVIQIYFMR